MKRIWTSCAALLCAALAIIPGDAPAQSLARQYTIDWKVLSFTTTRSSCLVPQLHIEGDGIFTVNAMPVPTFTVRANTLTYTKDLESVFRAPFSGSLLKWGQNDIGFSVMTSNGGDGCTFAEDTVDLNSEGIRRRLFFISRIGLPFEGVAPVSMDLSEINPVLARSLADLEQALISELDRLNNLGFHLDWARQQAAQLTALQEELQQLMSRSLDSITEAELDAMMARYSAVSPTVRQRLVQLLTDLKKSIEELRVEIDRIVAEFRDQMQVLDDYVLPAPSPGGVDVHDPNTYEPGLGDDQVAEVEVPDVSEGDVFDETKDPYAAFAQQTLEELNKTVSGGVVVDRQGFQAMVRLWRFNQDVFERGLKSRVGVSLKEWGAFQTAQLQVLHFIQSYMGEGDWFLDAPVRETTKAFVAMLEQRPENVAQARALKNNLNLWYDDPPRSLEQKMVLDTLDALAGGFAALAEGVALEDPTIPDTLNRILDGAVVATKAVVAVGLGLSPAGDFIDLCEVITGKELCNPWGADLTPGERMLSAGGLVIGSGKFWRVVGQTVGIGAAAVVTAKVAGILENIKDLSKAEQDLIVQRLSGQAFERMDYMKGQAILTLMDRTLKDASINRLAKRLTGRQMVELTELKMLTVDPVRLSKIADKGSAAKGLGPMYRRSVTDVRNELTAKGFGSPIWNPDGTIKDWTKTPIKDGTQEIWMHSDHSLVRISEGTELSRYLHIKMEITDLPGAYAPHNVMVKLTDSKQLMPPAPSSQMEWELATWYQEKAQVAPSRLIRDEYETVLAMQNAWAYATHIELLP